MEENTKSSYGLWFWIAIILGIIGLFSPILVKFIFNEHQYQVLSEIGDWWGGTSAVFISLAGIILLVLNYLSQKKELEYTRNEFKIQNSTLKIQRFESTFFHLIELYNGIVSSLNYFESGISSGWAGQPNKVYNGREVIEKFFNFFKHRYDPEINKAYKNEYEAVKATYNNYYREYSDYFEHYFETITQILKYINNAIELENSEKKFYFKILISQFSKYELIFIFYHGISNYSDEIKNILDEYELLKRIDHEMLLNANHLRFYKQFEIEI